ncbi:MAG: hypothetical protein ACO1RT_05005 [Planctomycetaceae bacterium]
MNPFASRSIRPDHNLFRFACDAELDRELRRQASERLLAMLRNGRHAAIIGPHGTGKSTMLCSLEPVLRKEFQHVAKARLTSERRHAASELWSLVDSSEASPHRSVCLIIDGFEQLRRWDRWWLLLWLRRRKHVALLVTSHRVMWRMKPFWRTAWDTDLARSLTEEKLGDLSAANRRELLSVFESRVRQRAGCTQNLRDLWFELYDDYETIKRRSINRQQGIYS